jgi:hypothetical protein
LNGEDNPQFYHCSSHGIVLLHIAANPNSTIQEIADALCLTTRSVWGIVGVLRRAGQIRVVKVGRTHYYHANMDATFFHPTVKGVKISGLGDYLASRQRQWQNDRRPLAAPALG